MRTEDLDIEDLDTEDLDTENLGRPLPRRPDHISETSHFSFGLRTPEIVERACSLFGSAELSAQISPHLRHAQNRFGGDVAIIGHQ